MVMAIQMERPKFPASNQPDMYHKLKQGIAMMVIQV
jgi:hypothetical protein